MGIDANFCYVNKAFADAYAEEIKPYRLDAVQQAPLETGRLFCLIQGDEMK